jgi:hypothetical protein
MDLAAHSHLSGPPCRGYFEWNPHKNNVNNDYDNDCDNEDQLAVGFKATARVHLYQVDRISMWLSSKRSSPTALPPKRTYTVLFYPRSCGTVSSAEFVDAHTILVNLGNLVYC